MKKKIVGILVCMLVFSGTVGTFQARGLNKEIEDQPLIIGDDEFDLSIEFLDCSPEVLLVKAWPLPFIISVDYTLKYIIRNEGYNTYNGEVELGLGHALGYSNIDFDQWTLNINLASGMEYTDEIAWQVYDLNNPDLDLETQFAGKYLVTELEIKQGTDKNLENNIDYGRAEYWRDEMWNPTKSQTKVNIPHSYRIIPVSRSLWYFDLPLKLSDFDDYPDHFKNRLGWTLEFATHFMTIIADITSIIREFIDFAEDGSEYVQIILNQIEILFNYFYDLIMNGSASGNLFSLLKEFISEVGPAVNTLIDLAKEKFPDVEPKLEKLFEDVTKFSNWVDQEPWKNPITVKFNVAGIIKEEKVYVGCRNYEDSKTDDDGDGWINFDFTVQPIYGNEVYYWDVKDCSVTIASNIHAPYTTPKIISLAFTNGTLEFVGPFVFKSRSRNGMVYIRPLQLLIDFIFERVPFLKALIRNISY